MEISIEPSLRDISAADWDALIPPDAPFLTHAFLALLEESKSVGPSTGWLPSHVTVRDAGRLVGAMPTYVKTDSYGEYIFDYSWAEAAVRAGIPYYPKVTVAVPFTPATGPRMLTHPEASHLAVWDALVDGLLALTERVDGSGIHVLFCLETERDFLQTRGFIRRATHQFHWRNVHYSSFDETSGSFLGALRAEARKQIRRERKKAHSQGLTFEVRDGSTLTPAEWSTFDQLYRSTSARKWGSPYLTPAFFALAGERVGHLARVIFARRGRDIVAGALFFERGAHLYGRYWGSFEELDCVHFEVCYYQLIERAIAQGATLVEAGAQGPHKLKRGFLPVVTHSAHRLTHPMLHGAVARAMNTEAQFVEVEVTRGQQMGPFRADALPPHRPSAGIPLILDEP